jgi:hypothetical protein
MVKKRKSFNFLENHSIFSKTTRFYHKIARFSHCPLVLGGDFNATRNKEACRLQCEETEEAAGFNAKETERLPVAGFNVMGDEEAA